jgi:hypothetical protein
MTDQVDGTAAHVQTCALCGEKFDSVESLDAHFSPQGRCRDPWTVMTPTSWRSVRYVFQPVRNPSTPIVWSLLNPLAEAAS